MATRTYTITPIDQNRLYGQWLQIQWTGLLNGDDGAPIDLVQYSDRCVQVQGTFGTGGTLVMEGRNDPASVAADAWAPLHDLQGLAWSTTAAKIEPLAEVSYQTRPRVPAGDGTTALTVTMIAKRVA